jgi:hypothetical protein
MPNIPAKVCALGLLLMQVAGGGVRALAAQDSTLVSALRAMDFDFDGLSDTEAAAARDFAFTARSSAEALQMLMTTCAASGAAVTPVPAGFETYTKAQTMSATMALGFERNLPLKFGGGSSKAWLTDPAGGKPEADIQPELGACKLDVTDWAKGGRLVAKITLSSGKFAAYGLAPSPTGTGPRTFLLWVGLDDRLGNEGIFRGVMIPEFTGGVTKPFLMLYEHDTRLSTTVLGCGAGYNAACWLDPPGSGMPPLPPPNAFASQTWIWTQNGCLCSGYGCH